MGPNQLPQNVFPNSAFSVLDTLVVTSSTFFLSVSWLSHWLILREDIQYAYEHDLCSLFLLGFGCLLHHIESKINSRHLFWISPWSTWSRYLVTQTRWTVSLLMVWFPLGLCAIGFVPQMSNIFWLSYYLSIWSENCVATKVSHWKCVVLD